VRFADYPEVIQVDEKPACWRRDSNQAMRCDQKLIIPLDKNCPLHRRPSEWNTQSVGEAALVAVLVLETTQAIDEASNRMTSGTT